MDKLKAAQETTSRMATDPVTRDTYAALILVGYTKDQAIAMIAALDDRKFESVSDMIEAIYAKA